MQTQLIERKVPDTNQSLRILKYECMNCGFKNEFKVGEAAVTIAPVSFSQKLVAKEGVSHNQKVDTKIQKKNSGKDRAKKRKQNSLSNMLSKRNEEKKNQKKGLSLSLESFMQG